MQTEESLLKNSKYMSMYFKRDLTNIGNTYDEVLANKVERLWVLFIKYDHSVAAGKDPQIKMMPIMKMPIKWVNIFKTMKPEHRPGDWAHMDKHIKTYEGPYQQNKTMRVAHVSSKKTLLDLLQGAFGDQGVSYTEEQDFSETLKPQSKELFGDIVDVLQR